MAKPSQKAMDLELGTDGKKLKKRGGICKRFWKAVWAAFRLVYRKLKLKHLTPLLFVVLYSLAGAGVFIWLEVEDDRSAINETMTNVGAARDELL